jgi:NAD(P)-dependent dehydrogenase (short-subunit alcohol dehydrogenase family)
MHKPVVLITGALTGIGRAAAVAFAQKGANVVVTGRRDQAGKELAEELRASARKPSSSTPTSATRTTSAPWSTRPSPGSAVSTSR